MRILILGAGPTGLGAAWRLQELGHDDWKILESSDGPGGLASSSTDHRGFTWDVGVHALHNHYPYFEKVLKGLPMGFLKHQRKAYAWMRNCWVPYPVQYNVHQLPPQELRDIVLSMYQADVIRSRFGISPSHFEEWLSDCFGDALCNSFLYPYNQKVWATPLGQMGLKWMGERVPEVDFEKVLRGVCLKEDQVSWGPNSEFIYPMQGGTGEIWRQVAAKLPREKLSYNSSVFQVMLAHRYAQTADGNCHKYDALISTAPLDWLSDCAHLDPSWKRGLEHTTTHVIGLGLKGQPSHEIADKNWIYFPEAQFPFYRAAVLSSYSPRMCPDDSWSLMMEVAESKFARPMQGSALVEQCSNELERAGFICRSDLTSVHYSKHLYGYPIPTLGRDQAVKNLEDYFMTRGVYSRGRFGHWKYEVSNQDHSFMQGVEVVDRLLTNKPETIAKF